MYALSMSKFLTRCGGKESIRRSWHHNLACAIAAKRFAQSFGRSTDEGYNAGLFHNIGRLALLALRPALYDQLIANDDAVLETRCLP